MLFLREFASVLAADAVISGSKFCMHSLIQQTDTPHYRLPSSARTSHLESFPGTHAAWGRRSRGEPGAGSMVVAPCSQRAADGHTLLSSAALLANTSDASHHAYDPLKDLAPVTLAVSSPEYWWCIPQ